MSVCHIIYQISVFGAFSLSGHFKQRYAKLFPSTVSGIKNSVVFAPMWNLYDIAKEGTLLMFTVYIIQSFYQLSLLINIPIIILTINFLSL